MEKVRARQHVRFAPNSRQGSVQGLQTRPTGSHHARRRPGPPTALGPADTAGMLSNSSARVKGSVNNWKSQKGRRTHTPVDHVRINLHQVPTPPHLCRQPSRQIAWNGGLVATQLHAFRFATTVYGRCRRSAANRRLCLARRWWR